MLEKVYYLFRNIFAKPYQRNQPSWGYWQEKIRQASFILCKEKTGILLEIGCGEGLFLEKIASKKDIERVGIDISADQLKKAKIKNKDAKLIQANAIALPFKDASFDLVVCINVFFNLPGEEVAYNVLGEIKRIAKKNSSIIFEIRNKKNPFVFLKYKLAVFYDKTIEPNRLRLYKLDDIKKWLKDLGISILKIESIGFPFLKFAPILLVEAKKYDK